ncbi:6-phosphofructokinase 1 [Dendrobium catenatum]|uniref:6-phosphofructokinase 1 n=1 Tax=Dendrobium catenatum TaxID=906689 RepID=A0A2I0WLX4_9ASPA|nr:6-phosphofructokinase 1 [Dendrobium catenatum]
MGEMGVPDQKIVEGPSGYVLEDVPHLTDYIPDLPTFPNPLQDNPAYSVVKQYFVNQDDTVPQKIVVQKTSPRGTHFRRAGPRQRVYFESEDVHACIVTCGGLCPGLNTVIREIVCEFDANKEHIGSGHNRYFVVPFGGKTTRFRGSRVITIYPAVPFGGETADLVAFGNSFWIALFVASYRWRRFGRGKEANRERGREVGFGRGSKKQSRREERSSDRVGVARVANGSLGLLLKALESSTRGAVAGFELESRNDAEWYSDSAGLSEICGIWQRTRRDMRYERGIQKDTNINCHKNLNITSINTKCFARKNTPKPRNRRAIHGSQGGRTEPRGHGLGKEPRHGKTSGQPEFQEAKRKKTKSMEETKESLHGKRQFLEFQKPVWNSKRPT